MTKKLYVPEHVAEKEKEKKRVLTLKKMREFSILLC